MDATAARSLLARHPLRPSTDPTSACVCAYRDCNVRAGVGALTAVFSFVNAVWFVPLPYPSVDRVIALATPDGGSVDGATFHAARERSRSIATLAAQRSGSGWSLAAGDHAEYVESLRVSQAFFEVVGVPPRSDVGSRRPRTAPAVPTRWW